jgi:hypothetical protein
LGIVKARRGTGTIDASFHISPLDWTVNESTSCTTPTLERRNALVAPAGSPLIEPQRGHDDRERRQVHRPGGTQFHEAHGTTHKSLRDQLDDEGLTAESLL